ncbi:tRNA (adenosine(37)-N6)-threonylcarbamoyltransferase complex dimerization subunit type 1 TsaB [Anaerobranca gottschalkii]|uniref:tRNA threonylcarbamoyladenosine biosynthesis protein TsaB n=1 Tax=Anaerobranca gottschalkii DSM 13577 TaxID=1120990 RepID=A0A1I0C415_9FIRM|nr:tRNA (adenosine(37)-N6)-threonylcarbamoyltransferase complex dimerization subunit type 1 TsaB [Anaerobranca gottschalkii]SET13666.1 tRNA threonylcarbamoyladenosine biosynthesis protein TsaB [Anaerobranca gottschalkii DSM 13577]
MLALSLETSTRTCSVALVKDREVLGEVVLNTQVTHSQKLLPAVDMLLKVTDVTLDQIDLIGVAVGPGSFTGLRIGIATAQGLAYGKKIPVVGISTLEALAYTTNITNGLVVPILNARRNGVYTAIFKGEKNKYQRLLEDSVLKLEELLEKLVTLPQPYVFTGDGVPVFKEKIEEVLKNQAIFVPEYNSIPQGKTVGILAIEKFKREGGNTPDNLKPEYIRLSEAERNLLKGCN